LVDAAARIYEGGIMTTQAPRHVTRFFIAGFLIVLGTSALHGDPAPQRSRIRALDERVGELLWIGYRQSPTFRRVVQALERSDVITYVEMGPRTGFETAGITRFAGRSGGHRYLRIVVNEPHGTQGSVVAVLGHELYHALEVAEARWVIDQASYRSLYERIGFPTCGPRVARCYDTRQATETGVKILGEFWER
jgi:hypothetical protein